MPRLFFFNVPAYGHVNPTLPVVTELVRRGHEVVYFDSASFEQAIQRTGAEFRPYPNSAASEADFTGRINNLVTVTVFILEETLRLLPFVIEQIQSEQPGLVVFDSIALWGMQAARVLGVPSAASICTFVQEGVPGILGWRDYLHVFRQAFTQFPALQRLRRQLVKTYGTAIFPGSSILPCIGGANIVYTSRAFQPDTPYLDASFHFVGPSVLAATREQADFPWDRLEAGRPKIYLSLGTLYNQNAAFYRMVFKAFAHHPAQWIVSVGRQTDLQALGPVPDNFIVLPSVPQLELLPKVDLFVTHGGMNSVNEGLYYGVPLLVVPQQIEQAMNGRQVARQGAGLVLADWPPYGRVNADVLRRGVEDVLANPGFRQQAGRLGLSFQEAGGYQAAADILSALLLPGTA